jgi:hypothetical protein
VLRSTAEGVKLLTKFSSRSTEHSLVVQRNLAFCAVRRMELLERTAISSNLESLGMHDQERLKDDEPLHIREKNDHSSAPL